MIVTRSIVSVIMVHCNCSPVLVTVVLLLMMVSTNSTQQLTIRVTFDTTMDGFVLTCRDFNGTDTVANFYLRGPRDGRVLLIDRNVRSVLVNVDTMGPFFCNNSAAQSDYFMIPGINFVQ